MQNHPYPNPTQPSLQPQAQPPVQPQAQQPSMSGLAIAGLVLGICAILISFVPIINNFAFLIALVGLILGIVGLVSTVKRTRKGKGIAIAAVVLCGLSLIIVLATQSLYSAALESSFSGSSSASQNAADAPSSASAVSSTGQAQDYAVSIDGCETAADYEGNEAIVVTFTFTNNSDADATFATAISAKAFQNGVELRNAIGAGQDSQASWQTVKPGGTITVEEGYVLADKSDVSIEVEELFSLSDDILASDSFSFAGI